MNFVFSEPSCLTFCLSSGGFDSFLLESQPDGLFFHLLLVCVLLSTILCVLHDFCAAVPAALGPIAIGT